MRNLIKELVAKQEEVNQTFDKIEKKLDECKSGMRKSLKCGKYGMRLKIFQTIFLIVTRTHT